MKTIQITRPGVFRNGKDMIPVGEQLTVPDDFKGWNGKWIGVGNDKEKTLEVATPAPSQEDTDLGAVRAEYERVTGEKPHGRKKVDTLREEIEAVRGGEDES